MAAGAGRDVVRTSRTVVAWSAGIQANRERPLDGGTRGNAEAFVSASCSFFTYDSPKTRLSTSFVAVPSLTVSSRVRTEFIGIVARVDAVHGARGDLQFRLYVQLAPDALALLDASQEFGRSMDNTVYHKGYPICYRSQGTPSIEVSVSRDGALSDIDYRSSKFPAFLFNGHLTAANSDVRAGNNDERHKEHHLSGTVAPTSGVPSITVNDRPKVAVTGGIHMTRRQFTTYLLAAPLAMKASLTAAATLDPPFAGAEPGDSLCYASVDELKALFRARKASPVDLLNAQIKRIEALNPKVNCITYKHFDQAMKEARESEARYRRGEARPLEGITVALKDDATRAGWKTTQGSLLFKDSPSATENAAVVDMLEAAGAVMPFQTTVPEFYLFLGASTRAYGTTRNPWNLEYSPGGSSAGSAAALAAGFTTLAIGSDMGGSIRVPASQNGIYGYRPTFGRVASGEVNMATNGPLARRFDDLVHFQNVIVGPSEKCMAAIRPRLDYPAQYQGFSGWRIAVDWGADIATVTPAMKDAMLDAIKTLRAAGCVVDEVDCGFSKKDKLTFLHGLMATSIGAIVDVANAHRDQLSPYLTDILDTIGGAIGPREAEAFETLLARYHLQVQQRVFGKGYRILLMPTMATSLVGADMFKSKEKNVDLWQASGLAYALTWPWNLLSRYPIVDVPLGIVEDRMPAGMQVIGQTFSDLDTFQFASNWWRLRPTLFTGERFPTFA